MKHTFRHEMEWSDMSEYSPSHTGQLPNAVVLPDGERVELGESIEIAYWNKGKSGAGYVQVHDVVRVREKSWCDNPSARHGKSGATLEVLAPKGSKFVFAQRCPFCGDENGEQIVEYYDTKIARHFQANDAPHSICELERNEQERLTEEMMSCGPDR